MNHLLTVADAVAAHARLRPNKIGARDSRRELTFAQWHERASRLANGLLALGLAKGDRVALLAFNCVEWMEIYVALARAGLVAVPINFRLTAPRDRLHRRPLRSASLHRASGAARQRRLDPRRIGHQAAGLCQH